MFKNVLRTSSVRAAVSARTRHLREARRLQSHNCLTGSKNDGRARITSADLDILCGPLSMVYALAGCFNCDYTPSCRYEQSLNRAINADARNLLVYIDVDGSLHNCPVNGQAEMVSVLGAMFWVPCVLVPLQICEAEGKKATEADRTVFRMASTNYTPGPNVERLADALKTGRRFILSTKTEFTADGRNLSQYGAFIVVCKKGTGDQPALPRFEPVNAVIRNITEVDSAAVKCSAVIRLPEGNDLGGKRLVYDPTGPLNRDYDDARRCEEAAFEVVDRAIAPGECNAFVYIEDDENLDSCPVYGQAVLVTLLGVARALGVVDSAAHECPVVTPDGNNLGVKRLVYAPTGPISRDYDDARPYEAAFEGVKRAIAAGARNPFVYIDVDEKLNSCPVYGQAELVSVLGAMRALYVPLEICETEGKKATKADRIAFHMGNTNRMAGPNVEKLAHALEAGRIVTRDIGGSDPERMASPCVAEYVKETFSGVKEIKIEYITDQKKLEEFPLLGAVNHAASVIDRYHIKVMILAYVGEGEITENVFLVGKGIAYDSGGADMKADGVMARMHQDKCEVAAASGFFKNLSILRPIEEYVDEGEITENVFLVGKNTDGVDVKPGSVAARIHRDKCGAATVTAFFKSPCVISQHLLRLANPHISSPCIRVMRCFHSAGASLNAAKKQTVLQKLLASLQNAHLKTASAQVKRPGLVDAAEEVLEKFLKFSDSGFSRYVQFEYRAALNAGFKYESYMHGPVHNLLAEVFPLKELYHIEPQRRHYYDETLFVIPDYMMAFKSCKYSVYGPVWNNEYVLIVELKLSVGNVVDQLTAYALSVFESDRSRHEELYIIHMLPDKWMYYHALKDPVSPLPVLRACSPWIFDPLSKESFDTLTELKAKIEALRPSMHATIRKHLN
ncbi:uncharacterized protein LOC129587795 isoform X2 [Paramacrobiotus metropolitanus]|uniref:uncharacterized protein LOC129587795 isoform X2 n=1 Tax=Paramacrobiotus metropolitanus TaxID=2943436 RepID=UPI00244621BD|nr:uncharacterized protein LOC129587795 isoform X2 [Paramacrobiotus metropolitanus]